MAEEKSSITFERVKISLLLIFLLWIQWLLFKQYAMREILWGYPDFSDQNAYLSRAFALYDLILDKGLLSALKWDFFKARGTGSFLHLQGAFAFLLNGPHRFNALTLNFIYYALFQAMLVYVVYFFSQSWKLAFICLGILMSSVFPFSPAGGFHDFRIDFISFCLFGIFLLSAIRSEIFINKKWAVITGVAGAYLFLFRHNTIVYMAGIYALAVIGAILKSFFNLKDTRSLFNNKRLKGILLSGGIYFIVALPFLWVNFQAILSYYLSQAIDRSEIRNAQLGIGNKWETLVFYPIQLFHRHFGGMAFSLALFTIFLFVIASIFYKKKYNNNFKGNNEVRCRPMAFYMPAYSFAMISFFVPFIILTLNASKSSIVAGILYPPLLATFVLTIMKIYSLICEKCSSFSGMKFIIVFMLCVSLFLGLLTHAKALTTRGYQFADRGRVEKMVDMHLELGRIAASMCLKEPSILIATIRDDLCPRIPTTLLYEHDRQLVVFFEIGETGQIFADSEEKIMNDLKSADFMFLRKGPKLSKEWRILPYNQFLEQMRPRLRAYAETEMIFVKQWQIGKDIFTLYTSPRTEVPLQPGKNLFGDSCGWITDKGFTLQLPLSSLVYRPVINIKGDIHQKLFKGDLPESKVRIYFGEKQPEIVPSTFLVKENHFEHIIDLSEVRFPSEHGICEIQVEFDAFFVPSELGINSDTRRLVIQTPEKMQLTTFSEIKEIDRSE